MQMDSDNEVRLFKGLFNGILLSLPFWAVVLYLVSKY